MSRTAALACAVGLLTAIAISFVIHRGRATRALEALDELPNTSRAVLIIEPTALDDSASAGILVAAFVGPSELSDIETACDLDPIRDLREILVWVRGSDRKPLESFGVQLEALEADGEALAQCHASLVEARGNSVVRVETPTGPLVASEDRRSALAVVDDRTVVTGSVPTVAEALSVRRGLLPALRERSVLTDQWAKIRRGAALAAIVDLPETWKSALERIPPFDEPPGLLDSVRTVALSAKTGPETTVTLRIDTSSSAAATEVTEWVRAWAEHPPASLEPPWRSVLQSAKPRVEGDAAVVTLDVSALQREPLHP